MSDDIVTYLRALLDGPVPFVIGREDVRDAVDEIERLRMIIRNYHKAEQEYSQEWDDGYNDDHIVVLRDSWKMAWQALDDEATRE